MDTYTLHGFTGSPDNWQGIVDGTHLGLLGHTEATRLEAKRPFLRETERIHGQLPTGCHLVGYSLGARLALSVALEYPKTVGLLTLIGGRPGLSSPSERLERKQNDAKWSECLRQQGLATFVDRWEALELWDTQKSLPEKRRALLRQQRLRHDPIQLALALDSVGLGNMPDYASRLSELVMPVHLITGALDAKFSQIADQMASGIRSVRQSSIADCGHNPLVETPQALRLLIGTVDHDKPTTHRAKATS